MFNKLKLKGGIFAEETEIELFPKDHRISLIYGKNGSGKSTISKSLQALKGDDNGDNIIAELYDYENNPFSEVECVHVFNEDYITSRVKLKEDGLNTIVLVGELAEIEDKIDDIELKLEKESKINESLKSIVSEYKDSKNRKSPTYCRLQINIGLSGDGHWAEREKNINDGKRNAVVNDKTMDSIVNLKPTDSLADLRKDYDETIQLLRQVRKNDAAQIREVEKINAHYDEKTLNQLLAQRVERPTLTEREQYILHLIDKGKIDWVNEMKSVFSNKGTEQCPFCFQSISDKEKDSLVKSIERILSEEVDIHEKNLRKCLVEEIQVDFSGLEVLESTNYIKCKDLLDEINKDIFNIHEVIFKKINHPYTPIVDFKCNLAERLKQYETYRGKLQKEIETYNDAVNQVEILKRRLTITNANIARYEIDRDIDLWKQALDDQRKAEEDLKRSNQKINEFKDELNTLVSRKKNINIAVSLINRSLRYVFFSKERLEIKIEDNKYILHVNGKNVKPANVSIGERNIIALSYFFTELIMNQNAKDGYSKRVVLILDDPVSSFDFENKVGIMSLLNAKIGDIIKMNIESQILIMTHDIQCLYDLEKICKTISDEYKRENNGEKLKYSCQELKNKRIIPFNYSKRNEYSEIMKSIYAFACGEQEGDDLTVGNSMRRVLEAFSTFVYKKGIADVSRDDEILRQMKDKEYVDYFKNLMYRLVLNGDSHMQERTNSMEDMDYILFLSDDERRRTAREVICFIYLLNEQHVLVHLDGKKDAEKNIKEWCRDIKGFFEAERRIT